MTHADALALQHDLEAAGVRVVAVRQSTHYRHLGEWEIVAWCETPAHQYSVTDAALFRESVRSGLIPFLPRTLFDTVRG